MQIKNEEIIKIKSQLPKKGAYLIISGMVNGVYKPNTVRDMFNQHRKMNPGILQAAQQLIELIANSKTEQVENIGYNRQTPSLIIKPGKTKTV